MHYSNIYALLHIDAVLQQNCIDDAAEMCHTGHTAETKICKAVHLAAVQAKALLKLPSRIQEVHRVLTISTCSLSRHMKGSD